MSSAAQARRKISCIFLLVKDKFHFDAVRFIDITSCVLEYHSGALKQLCEVDIKIIYHLISNCVRRLYRNSVLIPIRRRESRQVKMYVARSHRDSLIALSRQ